MSHEARLRAVERRLRPAEPMEIRIRGGLPGDGGFHDARADDHRYCRGPDETEAAFIERVRSEARTARCKLVVFGGLPDRPDAA